MFEGRIRKFSFFYFVHSKITRLPLKKLSFSLMVRGILIFL